ncbi:MAG TPA: glutaredoxin family protein [Burkholderiaceae bacterium]|jgi:glutaredoxin|nr:glutaredoxin family protein [Burkholderiaceae bacterium]
MSRHNSPTLAAGRRRLAPPLRRALAASCGALIAGLLTALPAHALYKVVGPDGKVTYTDRMPDAAGGKVTPLNAAGNAVADPAMLPPELQKVVARYPVTLFVTADCTPCDNARALLRQRGVPHAEKIVQSGDDADALQRLTGTRDVPTLMLGTQSVPGFDPQAWNGYLNAAGYPQQSMLPQGYQFAAPTPLQPRREAAQPAAPNALEPLPAAEPLRNAAGIRF